MWMHQENIYAMKVQDHDNWIKYTLVAAAVITYQCRQHIHVKDIAGKLHAN
jgi:hypothetical protein